MGVLVLPTAAQRQRQAEWMLEHEKLMRERLLGCALIITSPFLRLALSAVLHLRPLPTPYVVVHDLAAGLWWSAARLEEAGVTEAAGRIRRHFGMRELGPSGAAARR